MFSYALMVQASGDGYEPVRPGPDMEFDTLAQLCDQLRHDLGYVPDWVSNCPEGEYMAVEEEIQVGGCWFCLVIEGSTDHVMPPLAQQIAWTRNHGL